MGREYFFQYSTAGKSFQFLFLLKKIFMKSDDRRGDNMVQYAQKRRQPLIFRGFPAFLLLLCYQFRVETRLMSGNSDRSSL